MTSVQRDELRALLDQAKGEYIALRRDMIEDMLYYVDAIAAEWGFDDERVPIRYPEPTSGPAEPYRPPPNITFDATELMSRRPD